MTKDLTRSKTVWLQEVPPSFYYKEEISSIYIQEGKPVKIGFKKKAKSQSAMHSWRLKYADSEKCGIALQLQL